MAKQKNYTWSVVSVVVGILIAILALPTGARTWAPSFLRTPDFHLGLDLAGGTQLDFRISEEEINTEIADLEQLILLRETQNGDANEINSLRMQLNSIKEQRENLIEAIRTVLERRVNSLGVSEAVITPSYVGNEKHLLVECPGVIDEQECIATVGKTIQLEFKEQFTEATEEFRNQVTQAVTAALTRISTEKVSLDTVGLDGSTDIGTSYQARQVLFQDQLPEGLESAWNLTPTSGIQRLNGVVEVPTQVAGGQEAVERIEGVFLVEALTPRFQTGRTLNTAEEAFDVLAARDNTVKSETFLDRALTQEVPTPISTAIREMNPGDLRAVPMDDNSARIVFLRKRLTGESQMSVSHILIAYAGADSAEASVTRTKEEAAALAADLKKQLDAGADFVALARLNSDGPSAAEGGSLGTLGRGTMVPAFENVAFGLATGQNSTPVETQFGYHIIRADSALATTPEVASYDELTVTGENASEKATNLLTQLQNGEVRTQQDAIALRTMFYSFKPTGWKATLLDGKHFRAATVTTDPTTSIPVVQISFDEEGGRLFQELTKTNIGKPIAIFVGGELVSAPTVQSEIIGGTAIITGNAGLEEARLLAQDLNTGAIPAPIFLTGQHKVEATLGTTALEQSLYAAIVGMIILMLYMIIMYRLLGLIANIGLLSYIIILLAMLKLPLFLFTSQYIVLTLAGLAGLILSVGMAVDANVLIFERIKEELRKGKLFKTAAETGYERAWTSIRDGNVSTLITSAILFLIGTSVVRGFAITLSIGVMISMFTAIIVSRWIIRHLARTSLAEKTELFGVKRVQKSVE